MTVTTKRADELKVGDVYRKDVYWNRVLSHCDMPCRGGTLWLEVKTNGVVAITLLNCGEIVEVLTP